MKLQWKLISAFGVLAVLNLGVGLLAYWEANRLGSALYEVGVVRLPSIRGLSMMDGALAAVGGSTQVLLLELGDETSLARELDRQTRAWRRFDDGWNLYEPLPQTDEEAIRWRTYVTVSKGWRAAHTTALAALAGALRAGEATQVTTLRRELADADRNLVRTQTVLEELTALNYRVAEEAQAGSVASYRDMVRVRNVMLLSGVASVAGAILFGIFMGRRLSRPVVEVADALSKVAGGDLTAHVDNRSRDELGQMARAMNHMVETLRTGEARLRLLSDNLPDSMVYQVVREPDGTKRFLHVSAGVERLHGHTAAEVLGDATLLYRQILPEDLPAVAAAEAASFESMTVFKVVVRMRRADGAIRWMQIGSQPRRLPDGRTVWDGIETDVTERKLADEEMRRTHRAMRTLSRCNHVLVHAVEEEAFLRDICRVIAEDGGYRLAWVGYVEHDAEKTVRPVAHAGPAGVALDDLKVTWADTERGRGPTGTAIRTGRPVTSLDFETNPAVAPWRERARQLGVRCAIAFPLMVDGVVFGAVSIYSADREAFDEREFKLLEELAADLAYGIETLRARGRHQRAEVEVHRLLAEAEQARGALTETAERLDLALRASNQGVWRRNLGTDVGEWDARMKQIFGLAAGAPTPDFTGFVEFILAEDRAVVREAWRNLAASGTDYDQQFRIRRCDGEVRHVHGRGILVRDGAGRAVSVTGVIADLTDVVRTTEESGRLREKLRQAQKMETLGTLAAGIAHDFNNLLTGINGFIELGAASLPPEHETVDLLRQARQGAMGARDLVRRILTFSRLVPADERAIVRLPGLVRETVSLVTAGLPASVTLSVAVADVVPSVRADPAQIQQVLLNLCVNGAHAIGGEGGRIQISLSERVVSDDPEAASVGEAKPGRYACLTVTDTGCGMSADVCARIFEPFFTTKKVGEGTGLGLSVVHDIVTEHAGVIHVRSEPGRGTTFEVLLPATNETVRISTVEANAGRVRGGGERILVVDDETTITAFVLRALTHAGYAPEIFNSSPEAWERFVDAPGRYSLILLDHQMPHLTGAEFARRVRQATATLPIVIMTARTGDLNPEDLQRLGGVGVLPKPFELEELVTRVRTVLPVSTTPARAPSG